MIPQDAIEKSIAGGWVACDIGRKWTLTMYEDAVEFMDPNVGGCLKSMDEIAADKDFWKGLVKAIGLTIKPSELSNSFKAMTMVAKDTSKFWKEVL